MARQPTGGRCGPAQRSGWAGPSELWRRRAAGTQDRHARTGSYFKKPTFSPKSTTLPTLQTVGTCPGGHVGGPNGAAGDEAGPAEEPGQQDAAPHPWVEGLGRRERRNVERTRLCRWPSAQRALHSVSPEAWAPGAALCCGVTSAGDGGSLIGSRRCRSWCRAGRPPRPPGRWPAAGPRPRWSAGIWGTRSGS